MQEEGCKEKLQAMTVRDILRDYPETKDIFDKYGLSGCGGSEGPAEPLSFFARVHQVDEDTLLSELLPLMKANGEAPETYGKKKKCKRSQIKAHPEIYKLFLKTSLAFLIFGSSLGLTGMLLLALFASLGIKTSFSWGALWGHIVPIHGHIQLFGFASMFIMGIAYHVVPRFLMTELGSEKLARVSYYAMTAGILLTVFLSDIAQKIPMPFLPAVGALLEVVAVTLFIAVIFQTAKKSSAPPAVHTTFLRYGGVWLFAGALFAFLSFAAQGIHSAADLSSALKDASLHAMLFGFIFFFISGVALRTLHLFMGLREPSDNVSRAALNLMNAGIIAFVIQLFLSQGSAPQIALFLFSSFSALVSGMLMMHNLRLFTKPQFDLKGAPVPRDYEKYVRGAFAWLGAGLALYFVSQILYVAGNKTVSSTLLLSARHILTIGFMAQMTFGMASRIVPVFQGVDLKSARILNACFVLLNGGIVLRVAFQILSGISGMSYYPGVAVSGTVHSIAFCLLSYNIWATMNTTQETKPRAQTQTGKQELPSVHPDGNNDITPESIVWNVINEYPQTLDVFVRFGLDKLRNPVLRNTMARTVTIQKACAIHNVDANALVSALRESAGLTAPQKKIVQDARDALIKV